MTKAVIEHNLEILRLRLTNLIIGSDISAPKEYADHAPHLVPVMLLTKVHIR